MQPHFNIQREKNNTIFYRKYRNDKCLFQFHSQIEIYFVDEGEMEMFVSGTTRVLHENQLSVALSYDTHAYKTPTSSRSSVLLIPPHMCEEFMNAVRGKRLRSPFITDPDIFAKLKQYYLALQDESVGHIQRLGYIYTILGIIMDHVKFEDADGPLNTDLASQILFYTTENYKNGITPSSIAEHFGYSLSYVSRYFKSCFGITLGKYLTIVKLKNAAMLMHEGHRSISYCAMESGFTSIRSFYRAFHEEFGCSPKDYVEQAH